MSTFVLFYFFGEFSQNLLKETRDDHPDKKNLIAAHQKIKQLADATNQKKREREQIMEVCARTGVEVSRLCVAVVVIVIVLLLLLL